MLLTLPPHVVDERTSTQLDFEHPQILKDSPEGGFRRAAAEDPMTLEIVLGRSRWRWQGRGVGSSPTLLVCSAILLMGGILSCLVFYSY